MAHGRERSPPSWPCTLRRDGRPRGRWRICNRHPTMRYAGMPIEKRSTISCKGWRCSPRFPRPKRERSMNWTCSWPWGQRCALPRARRPQRSSRPTLGHGRCARTWARPPQLFPALRGLCRFYQNLGALATARELGEQLCRLAQRVAAPTPLLEAHDTLGVILSNLGDYTTARTHLEQGIALTDPAVQRTLAERQGEAHGVHCLAVAANTLWCLGYPTQAVERGQEALALAQALAHPYSLTVARYWAARLYHHRRDVPAVQAQADAFLT